MRGGSAKPYGGRDIFFMRRALRLARRGEGKVHPNPLVGAVLVKNSRIIGRGFHERFGGVHAERAAILSATQDTLGATLYLTLEPCSHFGKTPPCADFLIQKKIRRVVVACPDPNPVVSGQGIALLRKAGLRVDVGVLAEECAKVNRDFFYWVRHRRPYVILKMALSLDGRAAAADGGSRWISSVASRDVAQKLRAESDAILVGVETILKDNPRLSVRDRGLERQPLKVILDSQLRTSLKAKIFAKSSPGAVLVATTQRAPQSKIKKISKVAEVKIFPSTAGRVSWQALLKELGRRGVVRVLVEGGATTASSALAAGTVNEVCYFVAPKLLGGARKMSQALELKKWSVGLSGKDLVIRGLV